MSQSSSTFSIAIFPYIFLSSYKESYGDDLWGVKFKIYGGSIYNYDRHVALCREWENEIAYKCGQRRERNVFNITWRDGGGGYFAIKLIIKN